MINILKSVCFSSSTGGKYHYDKGLLTEPCIPRIHIHCLQKLALILFKSARDGGYTNPIKVEQILGVSDPEMSTPSEAGVFAVQTSFRSKESGGGKSNFYSSTLVEKSQWWQK